METEAILAHFLIFFFFTIYISGDLRAINFDSKGLSNSSIEFKDLSYDETISLKIGIGMDVIVTLTIILYLLLANISMRPDDGG